MKIAIAAIVSLALYSMLLCDGNPKRALRLSGLLLIAGAVMAATCGLWFWALA